MSLRLLALAIVVFSAACVGLAYLLTHWPVATVSIGSGLVTAGIVVADRLKRKGHPALQHPDDLEGKN